MKDCATKAASACMYVCKRTARLHKVSMLGAFTQAQTFDNSSSEAQLPKSSMLVAHLQLSTGCTGTVEFLLFSFS